ncbi:DnaA N-terminal domain-containing protein [Solibacillus sp. FSL K6-1523]|uniref:DnaA N-terminal domain-containing protein n=1 Tax=Solibacillus sp. FSL K6-1523 TaxID=2921471 RepID=UPI0030F9C7EC
MENEKRIIELLQEIKQEQQRLHIRFDEMDENVAFLAGEIGKLSMHTVTPTMEENESTTHYFEANEQLSNESSIIPINETISFENLGELWNHVLSQVSQEVSKPSFDTWIKSSKLLSYNENNATVTITAPNAFARDWLENHFSHLIKGILTRLTDEELSIEFVVQND